MAVPIDALPDDPEALRALVIRLATERDAALAESQRVSEQNDRLRHLLRQLQRNQFGRRSERLDADQLQPSSAAPGPARPTSRSPSPAAASATRPVPASTTSSISSTGSRPRPAMDTKDGSPII